jgi:hypothetical protein
MKNIINNTGYIYPLVILLQGEELNMKEILWWFKPPKKRLHKGRLALGITILILLTTITAIATNYALLNQGSVVQIGEAIYRSYTPTDASGSGTFDSFVRVSAANQEVVKGYNTDYRPVEFDENTSPSFTRSYKLSNVPIVNDPDFPGVYREFQLDINQTAGQDISLDEVEVYLTMLPDITGYPFPGYAAKVYELDEGEEGNSVRLNYDLAAGSGKRDMILRIPDANFYNVDGYPYCSYKASECTTYVVLYSHFGEDQPEFFNDDGFEEWGVEVYDLATKSGTKFNDLNHNGVKDNGEPGLSGWTIYVDINGNGAFDTGEPFAVTGIDGFYEITNIVPNPYEAETYKVREIQQPGWICTLPTQQDEFGCYYEEHFAAGDVKAGNDFGNYPPELTLTKDANTTYTRTYEWSIVKDFDATYDKFIGDPAWNHEYEVTVTKTGYTDSGWAVSGQITIFNDNPIDAEIMGVSDEISSSIFPEVDCDVSYPYTLPAGGSLVCRYSSGLPNDDTRVNTATVTTSGDVAGGSATADVIFGNPSSEVNSEINVTDSNGEVWGPVSETTIWNYTKEFSCSTDPADYFDGISTFTWKNEAEIVETGQKDPAWVTVNCYAPLISKTAAGTYDERHEWSVLKTVDLLSQSAFAGDTVLFNWTITVDEDVFEENFDVAGTITVGNPNPEDALVVALSDELSDSTVVDITGCTGGTYEAGMLTVPAGGSAVCSYEALDLDYDDVLLAPASNSATITLNNIDFSADASIEYAVNVIRGSATLDDDQFPYSGEAVSDGWSSTYQDSYTCSTNKGDYTGGSDLDNEVSNTAIVFSGGSELDRSTATTEIDCYAPVVSKDANTFLTRTWDWDITKGPDGEYWLYMGEDVDHTYTIDLDKVDFTDSDWVVKGTITVVNPNPFAVMTVSLADVISGFTGEVTLYCDGSLVVPAGGNSTCDYSAELPDGTFRTNTATVTLNAIDFTAEADVDFSEADVTEVYEEVHVTDVADGRPGNLTFGPYTDDASFGYTRNFVCPTDMSLYINGMYSYTIINTATIDETGDWDDATVIVHCKLPYLAYTPGFWKNHGPEAPSGHNAWEYTNYDPDQRVDSVFELGEYAGKSPKGWKESFAEIRLIDALSFKGGAGNLGAVEILLRAGTASLLNASFNENLEYFDPDAGFEAFPYSVEEVINLVNEALASGDRQTMLNLAAELDAINNDGIEYVNWTWDWTLIP